MHHNHIFQNVNEALPRLLHELQTEGDEVGSRAGRTMELTHIGITLEQPWQREVLTPGRKPSLAAQIAETMWVLSGRDDMDFLSNYLPRAKDFSDDGKTWRAGYGKRLRAWPRRDGSDDVIDQLAYVVRTLEASSLSRQAVMSIWDPQIDTAPGKDIPCNDWISFSNRKGRLDMHVALRSNDVIWGWSGINAFEWSTMLEVVAGILGVQVGALHFSTTSFHLYDRHWRKASRIVEDSQRSAADIVKDSPRFTLPGDVRSLDTFDHLCRVWFDIEDAIRTGNETTEWITAEIEAFPEPMMQSWLRVIRWWWTGKREYLAPLTGTAIELATYRSIQPSELMVRSELSAPALVGPSPFIEEVCALHNEKHAAYGDSWKRRGEMLGILANIARKVDRLGQAETSDETSADTAIDLLVYLAKYRVWLDEKVDGPISTNWGDSNTTGAANELMRDLDVSIGSFTTNTATTEQNLRELFDELERQVMAAQDVQPLVTNMLRDAYRLSRTLWHEAQAPNGGHDFQLAPMPGGQRCTRCALAHAQWRGDRCPGAVPMTDAASVGGGIPGSWTEDYRGADRV